MGDAADGWEVKMSRDQGIEFLQGIVIEQKGKPVEGAPIKGAYKIRMRPRLEFVGDRSDALAQLAASFPGCTFEWGEEGSVKV